MATHTKCGRAKWPVVASRSERMDWIVQILKDDGIACRSSEFADIAYALLKNVADDDIQGDELRTFCFRAAMVLEKRAFEYED